MMLQSLLKLQNGSGVLALKARLAGDLLPD